MIVLHYTAMASAPRPRSTGCAIRGRGVGALPDLRALGRMVAAGRRGRARLACRGRALGGRRDVNSRSIGIELANRGDASLSRAADDDARGLMRGIMHALVHRARTGDRAFRHGPGRKIDPGPRFDWRGLARGAGGVARARARARLGDVPAATRRGFGYSARSDGC